MPLTLADVRHIAELAKLGLTAEEEEQLRDQLAAILDHFAQLQTIDTRAISPTATVLPIRTVLRDDVVLPSLSPEEALRNAPAAREGYFCVSAILE
jgi:aspartyl-tRNA(Asn)/glutamyl-tRNA(Gln) amidotransferase subunit C